MTWRIYDRARVGEMVGTVHGFKWAGGRIVALFIVFDFKKCEWIDPHIAFRVDR